MIERNEVSRQEVEVFRVVSANPAWLTNAEIADQASGVAARTVRALTLKLVKLRILDQAEVFPAHRYRLSEKASKRNRGYYDRLIHAGEVFGVAIGTTSP